MNPTKKAGVNSGAPEQVALYLSFHYAVCLCKCAMEINLKKKQNYSMSSDFQNGTAC